MVTVFPELTSRKVIITEWVEGEKLNHSKAEDVRALCSMLLNCYLIQLLETGLLHADPHPGNLLRTAEGKIVILGEEWVGGSEWVSSAGGPCASFMPAVVVVAWWGRMTVVCRWRALTGHCNHRRLGRTPVYSWHPAWGRPPRCG